MKRNILVVSLFIFWTIKNMEQDNLCFLAALPQEIKSNIAVYCLDERHKEEVKKKYQMKRQHVILHHAIYRKNMLFGFLPTKIWQLPDSKNDNLLNNWINSADSFLEVANFSINKNSLLVHKKDFDCSKGFINELYLETKNTKKKIILDCNSNKQVMLFDYSLKKNKLFLLIKKLQNKGLSHTYYIAQFEQKGNNWQEKKVTRVANEQYLEMKYFENSEYVGLLKADEDETVNIIPLEKKSIDYTQPMLDSYFYSRGVCKALTSSLSAKE